MAKLDKMEVKAIKAGGSLDVMTKASKYAGTALLGIAGVLGTVAAVSIKAALSVQVSQSKLQYCRSKYWRKFSSVYSLHEPSARING